MIFKNMQLVGLLTLIPLLLMWFFFLEKKLKTQLNAVASKTMLNRLIPGWSNRKHIGRKILILISLTCLVFAILRPQFGIELEKVTRRGQDIMIAIDTSQSMRAQDLAPNRFDFAKQEILGLIDNLKGDRIGLIVFAGKSYIQCPLTSDYGAIKLFLNDIAIGQVPQPGTNLESALYSATVALRGKNKKAKSLILFTDGEYFDGKPEDEVKNLKKQGVKVYPIGLGSTTGEPIPIIDNNGVSQGFKRDKDNQIILSKLNEPLLINLAQETNGQYFNINQNNSVITELYNLLSKDESKKTLDDVIQKRKERYQWFLLPGFILLLLTTLLSEKKGRLISIQSSTKSKLPFIIMTTFAYLAASPTSICANVISQYNHNKHGINAYYSKDYSNALESFSEALSDDKFTDIIHYNLGNVFTKENDKDNAKKSYNEALKSNDPILKSKAFYNLGTIAQQAGLNDDAKTYYKQALLLNPNDLDAKLNLEILLSSEQSQQENKDKQQNNENNEDQKNNEDNKEENDQKQKQQNSDKEEENDKNQNQNDEPKDNEQQNDDQASKDNQSNTNKTPSQENIERILNALEQKEQDARKEYLKSIMPERARVEKDW